jgi:hypothetical protein
MEQVANVRVHRETGKRPCDAFVLVRAARRGSLPVSKAKGPARGLVAISGRALICIDGFAAGRYDRSVSLRFSPCWFWLARLRR